MFGSSLRGAQVLAERYSDSLDGPPQGDRRSQWIIGMGAAAVPFVWGVLGLARSGSVSLAVFGISLGLFIHFHWFWGLSRRLGPYSDLAKSIVAIPLAGSICYAAFRILAFG